MYCAKDFVCYPIHKRFARILQLLELSVSFNEAEINDGVIHCFSWSLSFQSVLDSMAQFIS